MFRAQQNEFDDVVGKLGSHFQVSPLLAREPFIGMSEVLTRWSVYSEGHR